MVVLNSMMNLEESIYKQLNRPTKRLLSQKIKWNIPRKIIFFVVFYLFSVEYNLLKRRRNKKNSWFFKEVNGLSINFEKGGTNEWKMVANGPPIITWKLMDLWHRRPISWKSLKNELDQTLPFLEEQASVRSFVSPLLTYYLD